MVIHALTGVVLVALIIWFFEVVLAQRDLEVIVKEYVG